MKNYDIKTISFVELLKNKNYSFFIKKAECVFEIYTASSDGGRKPNFISSNMGQKSDDLLEKFLTDMSKIAKKIIEAKDGFYYYMTLLMFIFLDINHGNLVEGGFTYCSHAQGFFTFFKKNNEVKNYFEDNFQNNYKLIDKAYNDYLNSKNELNQFYKTPKESIKSIKCEAKPSILNKEIYFSNYESNDENLKNALSKSHFHAIHSTDFMKKFDDIDFQLKRFITICQYYFLDTLGLSYKNRCFLCFAIYRYIEKNFNFDYTSQSKI